MRSSSRPSPASTTARGKRGVALALRTLLLTALSFVGLGLLLAALPYAMQAADIEYVFIDCIEPELNPPGAYGWDARCRCSKLDRMWEDDRILTSQTGSDLCWDGTPLTAEQIEARMRPWGITNQHHKRRASPRDPARMPPFRRQQLGSLRAVSESPHP